LVRVRVGDMDTLGLRVRVVEMDLVAVRVIVPGGRDVEIVGVTDGTAVRVRDAGDGVLLSDARDGVRVGVCVRDGVSERVGVADGVGTAVHATAPVVNVV
jgi:hypothetical protein